jgi:hypothetical protein
MRDRLEHQPGLQLKIKAHSGILRNQGSMSGLVSEVCKERRECSHQIRSVEEQNSSCTGICDPLQDAIKVVAVCVLDAHIHPCV